VHFDTALNLIWCLFGAIALASVFRASVGRAGPVRPTPWLHVIGVALIVAALFPYISATDDLVRTEDLASRHHSIPGKKNPNDNLIRLYEALDTPLACVRFTIFVTFFAIFLVFVPAKRRAHRSINVAASRSPPLVLSY
jgi:predicted membrane protein